MKLPNTVWRPTPRPTAAYSSALMMLALPRSFGHLPGKSQFCRSRSWTPPCRWSHAKLLVSVQRFDWWLGGQIQISDA